PVDLRAQAQSRRPHHYSHHALSGGSRGAMRAHRHAEGWPHRRARHQAEAALQLCRPHCAPRRREPPRGMGAARSAPGRRDVSACARRLFGAGAAARRAARGRSRGRRARAAGGRSRTGVPAHHGAGARVVIPAFGSGWLALFYKELLRFWKVAFQTILAPVLTALLYLLIFSHVLETRVSVFDGRVGYTSFLIPGLVMMSVLQNA